MTPFVLNVSRSKSLIFSACSFTTLSFKLLVILLIVNDPLCRRGCVYVHGKTSEVPLLEGNLIVREERGGEKEGTSLPQCEQGVLVRGPDKDGRGRT